MLLQDASARRSGPFQMAPELRLTTESLAQAIHTSRSLQPSPWTSWHYSTPSAAPVGVRMSATRTGGSQVRSITGVERARLLDENGDCADLPDDGLETEEWWRRFSCKNMQTVLSCIVILVFAMIAVIIMILLVPLSTNAISLVNQFDSEGISDHIDAIFEHTLSASLRAEAAASYMYNASQRTYDMVHSAEPALTTAINAGQSLAEKAKEFSAHPTLTIAGG